MPSKIYLYSDYREHAVINNDTDSKNIIDDKLNLPVGDFLISKSDPDNIGDLKKPDTDKHIAIIERKTWSDLESSITGGRYNEQKSRMSQFPSLFHIYLIEGELEPGLLYTGSDVGKLRSALVSTMLKEGFYILRSSCPEDTLDYLERLKLKAIQYHSKICQRFTGNVDNHYIENVKIGKKENMSPQKCFIVQLAQIPGISVNIATCISKHYSNWKSLISLFESEDGIKILSNISVGKNRLGPVKAGKIKDYVVS